MTVANPGSQSSVTGTAITAVTDSATDSQSGATLTWSATGLPAGLSINSSTGTITGTPTAAGTSSVTVKATDGAGYSGTRLVHLDGDQHGVGRQPGQPVLGLGHGHHPGDELGHRLPVRGHPDLVGHRPARRAVDQLLDRDHLRHAHHGRHAPR